MIRLKITCLYVIAIPEGAKQSHRKKKDNFFITR